MNIKQYIKRGVRYILSGVPQEYITANIISLPHSELLKGRTALVTGGTSGIGKAIATSFVNAGAYVIITGRNKDKLDMTVKEIMEITDSPNITCGILNNAEIETIPPTFQTLITSIDNRRIDILVNNAGVNGGYISNTNFEEYKNVLDTNLNGTFFLSKIVSEYMIQNNIAGNILNIASSSSLRPATSAYTLSKWGIRGLTVGLAKTLIKHKIVVNGLAPGPTATPMLIKDGNPNISNPCNPSGRYAMPEEIANMATILVSGMGRMIVGDIVYMTGGAGTITVDDISY